MAAMYAVYHGPDGLRRIARRVHALDRASCRGPARGWASTPGTAPFFDTLRVRTAPQTGQAIVARARRTRHQPPRRYDDGSRRRRPRRDDAARRDLAALLRGLRRRAGRLRPRASWPPRSRTWPFPPRTRARSALPDPPGLPPLPLRARDAPLPAAGCRRATSRSTHSMIPLGSCTMKLNGTSEMIPVTWPEFGEAAPLRARRAGRAATASCSRTSSAGWPRSPASPRSRCSRTPGSQGEYAGLLAIRAYHQQPRRGAPRRLPDPGLRPRHQPRERGHGRASGWCRSPATTRGNIDVGRPAARRPRSTRTRSAR